MGALLLTLQLVTAADLKPLLSPRQRPLLIHVWASWCAPCLIELPELAAGLKKRAVDVLWIDLDEKPAEKVWRQLGRVRGRAVHVPPAEAAPLKSLDEKWDGELPATWLLAPDGSVRFSRTGRSDLPELWKNIDGRER
jgi:thiol-disulfide isomerase/thioredoxin